MSKFLKKIVLLSIAFVFSNCAFLQSVSMTPQPPLAERTLPVKAEASKFVLLAFNFENDFLNEIPQKLMEQCKTGRIIGLITKYEHISYFIGYTMVVKTSGYCIK